MGFISDITTEEKVSIAFYSKDISVTNGVVQPDVWTLSKNVDGLMWFGTQGISFISDKLKTMVDGGVSIDYDSTVEALGDNSKMTIDSEDYEILHIENVGKQNEVLQILFKRVSSN